MEQGWITSTNENKEFSEAVVVHFIPNQIDLKILIEIHLLTHSSTKLHQRRDKYRSAVYTFYNQQLEEAEQIISSLQNQFENKIITKAMPFVAFKLNVEEHLNYFYKNPSKPFCQTYILPKLAFLMQNYSAFLNQDKLKNLNKIA